MRGERVLYYGKKLLIFIISVWVLSLVTFYVSRLAPGDPLISYYGERVEKMSPEEREWAEEKLGLNDKISVQYARWIRQAFHGNFGISYKYKMDVLEVLKSRIGNTLVLGGIGFLIIFFGSLLLGIVCAWKEGGWTDRMICKVGTVISCAGAGTDSCVFCFSSMAAKLRSICGGAGKQSFRSYRAYDSSISGYRDRTSLVLWLYGPKQNAG